MMASSQGLIDSIILKEASNLGLTEVTGVEKSLQALINAKPNQDSEIDVVSYLNENFSTVESLDNVDAIVKQLDS
jgi:hypothetical protein